MSNENSKFLQEFAQGALGRAETLSGRIGSFSPAPNAIDFNYTPDKPNISKPPPIGDLLSGDTSGTSIEFLNRETEKWLDKYFPNLSSCMKYQPEEWACGILTGQQPFGLSREVFETVWHEGRDRAYRAAGTEKAQIQADHNLRGFSLPNGAMVNAMRSAEIRASEAIAEVNRAQTINDAEIKLDLVKFAASTAAQIKTSMMQALANFYQQWAAVLNRDVDMARSKAQAYSALTSALSSYYNVELGFEELRLKAAQGKASVQEAKAKIGAQEGQVRTAHYSALASAVRAFTDVAGSAASAQGSLQAELYSGQVG